MSKDKGFLKSITDKFAPGAMVASMAAQFMPQVEAQLAKLNNPVEEGGQRQPGEDLVLLAAMTPPEGKPEIVIIGLAYDGQQMNVVRIDSLGELDELAKKML